MSVTSNRGADQAVVLGDTTLPYRVTGDSGPALLYLHGAGMPSWPVALDELARQCRVYAPELSGCGESVDGARLPGVQGLADVLGAFIRAVLPAERVHVVGTAAGATLALWVAVRHPEVVGRLVLVSPTALSLESARRLHPLSPEERRAGADGHPERPIAAGAEQADGKALEQRSEVEGLPTALKEHLASLETSVLALFGTRDPIVPAEMARVYRAQIPHCHVVFVYNAGHALHVDRPDAFVPLVAEFLTEGEGLFRNRGATGYMRAPAGKPATGSA
jgi:pimeloyl-ACP methyl ester carboxylesterase